MCATQGNFKESWNEHFQVLLKDLEDKVKSLELIFPEGESLTFGDLKSCSHERGKLRNLIQASRDESEGIEYDRSRYVFIKKQDDEKLAKPYFLFVSSKEILDSGKRGLFTTDYYDLVLIATFENEERASSVNAIIKCITSMEEDE